MTISSGVKTVYITIGNSDNKLTQQEWASFCILVNYIVRSNALDTFFIGHSAGDAMKQNACWSFSVTSAMVTLVREMLSSAAMHYRQDAIAMSVVDEVEMVKPRKPRKGVDDMEIQLPNTFPRLRKVGQARCVAPYNCPYCDVRMYADEKVDYGRTPSGVKKYHRDCQERARRDATESERQAGEGTAEPPGEEA